MILKNMFICLFLCYFVNALIIDFDLIFGFVSGLCMSGFRVIMVLVSILGMLGVFGIFGLLL